MSGKELEWIPRRAGKRVAGGPDHDGDRADNFHLPVAFQRPMGRHGQSLPASRRPARRRLDRNGRRW